MSELIDRNELLEIIFPLGLPLDDWDYCISARAIYDAIMKRQVFEREEVQGTPIESVDFSHNALRAFRKAEITTVEEVLAMSRKRLLSLYYIGPKAADKIIETLERQGYYCTNLKK